MASARSVGDAMAGMTLVGEEARSDTALLEDVLKSNGEEHLYSEIMDLAIHHIWLAGSGELR